MPASHARLPIETADRSRVLRALAHPLRHLILAALTDAGATTAELAARIARPRREVASHLRVLRECGAVEPIPPAPGAAATAPVAYRATTRAIMTDAEWRELPLETRRAIFGSQLEQISQRVAAAWAAGGFDAPDTHVSYTSMSVNRAAYDELNALLMETLQRALAIQAGARERRAGGEESGDEIETEIVLLHFGRHAAGEPPAPGAVERMYALTDGISDEMPEPEPDWHRIAEQATELAALARRCAAAPAAVR